jgi:hypothetical protein
VEINCPSCGTRNWLENQSRCFRCNAILRRCVNCANYDRRQRLCRLHNIEIDRNEAQSPSLLSSSTNCQAFRPAAVAA